MNVISQLATIAIILFVAMHILLIKRLILMILVWPIWI